MTLLLLVEQKQFRFSRYLLWFALSIFACSVIFVNTDTFALSEQ